MKMLTLIALLLPFLLLSLATLSLLVWKFLKASSRPEEPPLIQTPSRHLAPLWLALSMVVVSLLAGVGFTIIVWAYGPVRHAKQTTRSTIASIQLGTENRENGIQLRDWKKDGQTGPAQIADAECRVNLLTVDSQSKHFYFAVDDTFKSVEPMDLLIALDYFDGAPCSFHLQYDAVGFAYAIAAPGNERINGTQTWRKAYFLCRNSGFHNLQNGGADFRVVVSSGTLYLRRVAVVRLGEIASNEFPFGATFQQSPVLLTASREETVRQKLDRRRR